MSASTTISSLANAPPRRALDAAIDTSIVAAYLSLAIDCEDPTLRTKIDKEAILTRHGSPALLKYRTGICGTPSRDLTALREQQPQWKDTFCFEGRREMVEREIDLEKATARYASAHDAFPASPAITLALAHAQQSMADFEPALASFDLVIAATPTHRDALLGRLTTLSYMMRHPDAVATATRLIELGTWHIGDAYYWRAWNQFTLEAIEPAWQDVENARKLLVNTNVYMLAGLIEYARKQVDTAIERFDRAYELDSNNCDAVWFAALARVDKQDWPSATPKFARGMSCYVSAAAEARRQLAAIAASKASEVLKERRAAKERKSLEAAEHRAAQAAFNAAQGYLRQGNKALAVTHVEVAAAHPLLKEKAEELRKMIVSCEKCG